MKSKKIIQAAALFITSKLFVGIPVISAQSMASLCNIKQAELDLSEAVDLLTQNVLLALTVGVLLLGILLVYCVIKEYINSNRSRFVKSSKSTPEPHPASSKYRHITQQLRGMGDANLANLHQTVGYPTRPT